MFEWLTPNLDAKALYVMPFAASARIAITSLTVSFAFQ